MYLETYILETMHKYCITMDFFFIYMEYHESFLETFYRCSRHISPNCQDILEGICMHEIVI